MKPKATSKDTFAEACDLYLSTQKLLLLLEDTKARIERLRELRGQPGTRAALVAAVLKRLLVRKEAILIVLSSIREDAEAFLARDPCLG